MRKETDAFNIDDDYSCDIQAIEHGGFVNFYFGSYAYESLTIEQARLFAFQILEMTEEDK